MRFHFGKRAGSFTSIKLSMVAAMAASASFGCAAQREKEVVIRGGTQVRTGGDGYTYRYPVTAPVLNADELKRFVEQHRNQVVVVEFWASWSAASRDRIARLAELYEQRRPDGLRVIACTFDEPREWRSHTVPILEAAGANYPCVVVPPGARQQLGDWLDPSWRFDVPARFVVDRSGSVLARARGDEALLAAFDYRHDAERRSRVTGTSDRSDFRRSRELRVATASTRRPSVARSSTSRVNTQRSAGRDQAAPRISATRATATRRSEPRRYRSGSAVPTSRTILRRSSAIGPASTRVKLINTATGESEWLPVVSREEGLTAAADAVVLAIRSRVPRETNPRIALLPLSSMRTLNSATPLGCEAAESIVAGLRREGFYDLVEPKRAATMIRDAGLTPTQIDFDPSVVRGKISAEYLLMGWVRNDVDEIIRSRRDVVARESAGHEREGGAVQPRGDVIAGDAGASDTGYVSPRREAEDFGEW